MKVHEIENRALQIIDRVVKQKQRIEDSQVEAKSEWPSDPAKAARRIAGHANAVRAEHILWLIGLDDKRFVVEGVEEGEFSTWWAQVRAQFDGIAPDVVEVAVASEGKTVFALLFDSTRRPFVVKNPDGGTVQLEVPWREATGVRSARREDLIRVLSPLEHQPEFELQHAELWAEHEELDYPAKHHLIWYLELYGYLYVKPGSSFVIPFHTADGILKVESNPKPVGLARFAVRPQNTSSGTMESSGEQVVVKGPGGLVIHGEAKGPWKDVTLADEIQAKVVLRSREIEYPISITATLRGEKNEMGEDRLGYWYLDL